MRYLILAFALGLILKPLQAGNGSPQKESAISLSCAAYGEVNLGTSFWAAGGAGLADTTNPEALLYNPAWSASRKQLILGGGAFHSGMELGYSFTYPLQPVAVSIQSQFLFPTYLMAASRYSSYLFQAGYRLLYATNSKYEQDFILNNVHHQGVTYEANYVHDFFIGVNRKINRQLSLGAQAGLALLTASVRSQEDLLADAVGTGWHVRFGLLYQPSKSLSLALTYRHLSPIDYQYSMKKDTILAPDGYEYTLRSPEFFTFGTTLRPAANVRISMRMRYEHSTNDTQSPNRLQLSAGVHLHFSPKWSAAVGAFTLGDLPGSKHFEDVVFLTAGISRQILENLKLELSVLSSHFTSDFAQDTNQLDQTRIMMGMQFYLKN